MKRIFFTFILFTSVSSLGADEKSPCFFKNGDLNFSLIENLDCDVLKTVVKDGNIKNQYEDIIQNKIADKLTVKITQSLEEVNQLDQFYHHHKQDLKLGNDEVLNKCRLEVFANADCGEGKNTEKMKKRLEMIKSKFGKSLTDKDSFYDRLSSFVTTLRAPKLRGKLQCPITNKSEYFLLDSQLTEEASSQIFSTFLKVINNEFDKKHNDEYIEKMSNSYPQLKLLKNAGIVNKEILARFRNHLKTYDNNKSSSKAEFINSFFLNADIQPFLADGLVAQCESVTNNIKEFLCNDFNHLGTTTDFSEMIFTDDEESKQKENLQLAKGFSCEFKKFSEGETIEDVEKLQSKGSIENIFQRLSENTRPIETEETMKSLITPYCDLYSCKTVDSKELDSCKRGGPVSILDLEKYCNDPEMIKNHKCDENVQKMISYLKTLNDVNEIVNSNQSLASSAIQGGTSTKKQRYSAFFENFVGVKGTLLAEGRPITPESIAKKSAEFEERGISLSSNSKNSYKKNEKSAGLSPVNSGNTKAVKSQQEIDQSPANTASITSSNAIEVQRYINLGEERRQAEKARQEVIRNTQNKTAADNFEDEKTARNIKSTDAISKDKGRDEEIKKLRSELANVVDSMKGTKEEKMATISRNNRSIVTDQSDKAVPVNVANEAEKERLARYRENLKNWEGKLRNWEGDLNTREFSARNNSGARVNEADNRREDVARSGESFSNGAGAQSAGVRLTKAASSGGLAAGAIEGAKNDRSIASLDNVNGEVELNSDKLSTLEKASLKDFGVADRDSFIIKIRHKGKFYNVPVKLFNYKENEIYVPMFSANNEELAKIVLDSPLFSDYRKYEKERNSK